jgi:hypothetical protein
MTRKPTSEAKQLGSRVFATRAIAQIKPRIE